MQNPLYEYRGLKASTWDLMRCDVPEWRDRRFFRRVIARSGEPVLDVGCGTGRLLLHYLAQGIDIDGIDVSPEMLELCRSNARRADLDVRLFEQPMQSLDLPRRYRTIIVPSCSFQLLIDPADITNALCCFSRHLEPGGVVVLPFVVLYPDAGTAHTVIEDWKCVRERARADDGALVRLWSRRMFDMKRRTEHIHERFEVLAGGQVLQAEDYLQSPATRWYTQEEARELMTRGGFSHIRLLRGFTFQPASPTDRLFSVLAIKT